MSKFHSDKEILEDFYSIYWRIPIKKEFYCLSNRSQGYVRNKYGCYENMIESYGYIPTKGATYILTDVVSNPRDPKVVFVGTKRDICEVFCVRPQAISRAYCKKGRRLLWKYTVEKFEFEPIYDEDGRLKTELRRI